MINSFLDTSNLNKLKILNYLFQKKKPLSLNNISNVVGLSVKTVRALIQSLAKEVNGPEEEIVLIYNGKLLKKVYVKDISVESLAQEYLSSSLMAKMALTLFLDNKLDYKKFCSQEFISSSTFYKNLNKLKVVLEGCSLNLNSNLSLEGEEIVIRNFYYRFFTNLKIDTLPYTYLFSKIDQSLQARYPLWKKINLINKERILLLIYISILRNNSRSFIKQKELSLLIEEFECDSLYEALDSILNELTFINLPELEVDNLCFFIFKEHLLPFKIKKQYNIISKVRQNISYIKYSDILAGYIFSLFPNQIGNKNFKIEIKKCTDLFHAELSYCFMDPRDFFFMYDANGHYSRDNAELNLYQEAQSLVNLLKDNEVYGNYLTNLSISSDAFLDQIYIMIYNIKFKSEKAIFEKVRLYIQNSKPHVEEILKYKLSTLFQNNIEFVKTPLEEVDLIITDLKTLDEKSHSIQEFYISTFSDNANFNFLTLKITKLLLKKFENRVI